MTVIHPIGITSIASVSPLGNSQNAVWDRYMCEEHCLQLRKIGATSIWAAHLPEEARNEIEAIRLSDTKYRALDETVLFAMYTARKAVKEAGWNATDNFGINIGSSRGATSLFEKYHAEFLDHQKVSPLASPTTTLGNISSWLAHDLKSKGPEISHSITCSTALHAMLNGIAWIGSGMSTKFLVGGSEAALTPFTIAQMQALKVYAPSDGLSDRAVMEPGTKIPPNNYPCRALDLSKKRNGMVLGEGAAMACLERGISKHTLAIIEGAGYATEPLEHNASISTDARCFQESMKMALGALAPEAVDVIVMHAPGTVKGDLSEIEAIEQVFGRHHPALTTNKWKIGHTFGASGLLSIEMAVLMLQHQYFIKVPYLTNQSDPNRIERILVNAVGFGGNAVSILLRNPGQG